MRDRETGRSRGYGFVTFSTAEEANAAVEGLNETDLDGRQIRVSLATGRGGGGGGGGGGELSTLGPIDGMLEELTHSHALDFRLRWRRRWIWWRRWRKLRGWRRWRMVINSWSPLHGPTSLRALPRPYSDRFLLCLLRKVLIHRFVPPLSDMS